MYIDVYLRTTASDLTTYMERGIDMCIPSRQRDEGMRKARMSLRVLHAYVYADLCGYDLALCAEEGRWRYLIVCWCCWSAEHVEVVSLVFWTCAEGYIYIHMCLHALYT